MEVVVLVLEPTSTYYVLASKSRVLAEHKCKCKNLIKYLSKPFAMPCYTIFAIAISSYCTALYSIRVGLWLV